ncbi:MAG: FAD:protein FMN transferase, partial [Rhodothermales bacterium]
MVTVRLARMAMACRFELVLQGEHEPWLRAAGEEALREIERLEQMLSIFRPGSDVSRINARAAREPVRVNPTVFKWLEEAQRLHRQTGGAFDLTIAPLMQAWGFYEDGGCLPDAAELAAARRCTGMNLVELDTANRTVAFQREGMRLDFGAIGKGLAVDEAISILREAGVERAFLHGGTSTMYGLGRPFDEPGWKVVVPYPDRPAEPVGVVTLVDESLSVSAVWGKSFEAEGRTLGHVLDPVKG